MFCFNGRDSLVRSLLRLRPSVIAACLVMIMVFPLRSGTLSAADRVHTITIGGTGSALGGIRDVAHVFQKRHPDIVVKILPSLGSTGGIKAVLAGALSIALSARPLNSREKLAGASAVEYARTPFVFVRTAAAPERGLTLQEVVSIYAGELHAWPDHTPIRLIIRPEADADMELLKEISPEMEKAVEKALSREGMLVAMTDQENVDLLAKVKGAFGTSTLAQIISERRSLHALPLDGVEPSLAALAKGAYPYSKSFFAVTGPRSSPEARLFIEFLFSSEGKAILAKSGNLVR
jgi:phosphate transport system substrate-binding protein